MSTYLVDWQQESIPACRNGALAIGNFDGVHLGHAELIRQLIALARQVAGPAVAVTFDPHPRAVLRPESPLWKLTTQADRAEYLHELGVDQVLTLRVTPELLSLGAVPFFDQLIVDRLAARAIVEGTNFCFGRDREGDIRLLAHLCQQANIKLRIVPPVVVDGSEVSSSRIRNELLAGHVEQAAKLLGRPYRLRGLVGSGQRRGRTIGFPTANLEQIATVVPGPGVYAVRVRTSAHQLFLGAANLGANPTFAEAAMKIEVHLLDFTGDLYGQELALEFLQRLRETRRFASVAELIEQLQQDVQKIRCLHSRLEAAS